MKKIFLFLFSLVSITSFSQVKVSSDGAVVPTGNYPAVFSKDIRGTLHTVQKITDRNNIPNSHREPGMLVFVQDSIKYYYLYPSITNSNWQELKLGVDQIDVDSSIVKVEQINDTMVRFFFKGNSRSPKDIVIKVYTDTSSLSNRIDQKLNITDTTGIGLRSLFKRGGTDSVFYNVGGVDYFAFKDSSWNQPLLSRYSVPFVGSDGKFTQDNVNFRYDGSLMVGNGDFYSESGLNLNGGRGKVTASGFGLQIGTTGGGSNGADASKHIRFRNSSREYLHLYLPTSGPPQTTPLEGEASMNFYPSINDSFDLGKSNKRWKNGYFKNLYIDGQLFNPDLAGAYIPLSQKGQPEGVATLGTDGKVPSSQLPALVVNQPSYVQTLAEMLALPAVVGDIVVVGDSSKSYALMSLPANTVGNWLEIKSPVPTNTDLLPEGTVNKYHTDARARAALSGQGSVSYNPSTGVITGNYPDWDIPGQIINKPVIPTELTPIGLKNISITGTYPNLEWSTTNIYDVPQVDSIADKLRGEIQVAANGGVTLNQLDSTANDVRQELADTSLLLRSLIEQGGGGEGNVVNIETANSIYEIQGSEDIIYINRSGVQVKFPDPVLFPGKKIVIGTRSFPYIGDVFFSGTYLPKGYDLIGNSFVFTSQSVAQITDYVSDGTEWRATRQSYLTEVKNTVLGTGEGIVTDQTIYKNNGVAQYNLKRLKAGDGITVTKDGDNDILISATGSGGTTLQQVDSAVNTLRPITVKYADTTAMLSPYLRKIDTTGKWKDASYVPSWSELTGKPTLFDGAYSSLTGIPSTFTPSAHTHNASDINTGTLAIARIPTGTTSSTVALGNHTHTFTSITSKPTTISGYGITDFNSLGDARWKPIGYVPSWAEITGKPSLLLTADTSTMLNPLWAKINAFLSSQWSNDANGISYSGGNVGIGEAATVGDALVVNGIVKVRSYANIGKIIFGNGDIIAYRNSAGRGSISFGAATTLGANPIIFNAGSSTYTDGYMEFNAGGNNVMSLTSAGIGIKTATPTEALDVNGKIKVGEVVIDSAKNVPGAILTQIDNSGNTAWQLPSYADSIANLYDSIISLNANIKDLQDSLAKKDTINAALPLQVAVDENDKQTLQINWDKLEDSLLAKGWVKSGGGSGLPTTGYNKGDIFYANSSGNIVALPKGTNGQVLELDGDIPAWKNKDSGTMPDLSDRDFANDSIAVVDGGLAVGDWYRTGGNVKYLTTMPVLEDTAFYIQFVVNKVGDDDSVNLEIKRYSGTLEMDVDWGDGSAIVTGSTINTATGHKYADAGTYRVRVTNVDYSRIQELYVRKSSGRMGVSNINRIDKLTGLDGLFLNRIDLGSFIDTLTVAANISNMYLQNNTYPSGVFPNYINLSAVSALILSSTSITTWSRTLPNSLATFDFSSNGLTVQQVNDVLEWFDSQSFSAGSRTLKLKQGGLAPPSGSGATAKSNLEGKGWTVNVD